MRGLSTGCGPTSTPGAAGNTGCCPCPPCHTSRADGGTVRSTQPKSGTHHKAGAALSAQKEGVTISTPTDITPHELQPNTLANNPAPDWATDPQADPTQITNWPARQAAANVPFSLDRNGWPLNPNAPTGKTGRNLGAWGENQATDSIVLAGTGKDQHLLLIRRGDTGQWAIPGGKVDPGETTQETLARELHEEAGIDLSTMKPRILWRGYVDDPRNSDHAWLTTTVGLYKVPQTIPPVAGDDATEARWWPWTGNVKDLIKHLHPHGGLYPAHQALLKHLP